MPSPAKTSAARIVAAARELVERDGHAALAMADVAAAVGVRAPSLYGHFADRAALLAAIELELLAELRRVLTTVKPARGPVATLTRHARVYRAFAKAHPRGYALIFAADADRSDAGVRARVDALAPTMPSFVALVGKRDALRAARVLTPFMHGFVAMELAGAFRLGPGIDAAFEHGVATILAGLTSRRG
ncbi:MAG TPA: TetR-like C-terminal domain-containing protein [Kofleriaceae bacterium]